MTFGDGGEEEAEDGAVNPITASALIWSWPMKGCTMKTLVILLAMTVTAAAQTYGSCSLGSMAWGPATEADCSARGGTYYPAGLISNYGGVTVGGSSGAFITNSPSPSCDDGFTLVYSSTSHPMCARDLKEPTR